jgi:hypothetical protein
MIVHALREFSRSYWLGPALGATVAAGFYKFIKYLEYETVLGPEQEGDAPASGQAPTQGTMLSGGAPAMTGPNVAAGRMYEDASASKGPTMAIQGAGLGDLLTHGAPANVSRILVDHSTFFPLFIGRGTRWLRRFQGLQAFDTNVNGDQYYAERLDRIETMLGQLLANGTTMAPIASHGLTDGGRSSMATLNNDAGHPRSPLSHNQNGHEPFMHPAGYDNNEALGKKVWSLAYRLHL